MNNKLDYLGVNWKFFLFLIFFIQLIPFLADIGLNNHYPSWDQSWHGMISVVVYNLFIDFDYPIEDIENSFPVFSYAYNHYPHFFHTISSLFYPFFGLSYNTAILSNSFFLGLMVISGFYIGRYYGDERTGLILSFVLTTTPALVFFSREYLIDFALVSMVAVSFCSFIHTNNFENRKNSFIFGGFFGLGMLTKWSFFIYITPLVFVSQITDSKNFNVRFWNFLMSVIIALIIMSSWYDLDKISSLYPKLFEIINIDSQGGGINGISFNSLFFYGENILFGFSFFYCLLFILGIILAVKKKMLYKYFGLIFSMIFIYGFFSFFLNKTVRFILPVFVYLSVFCVKGLEWLLEGKFHFKWGKLLKAWIISLIFFQFVIVNYGIIQTSDNNGNLGFFYTWEKETGSGTNNFYMIFESIFKNNVQNKTICIITDNPMVNDVTLAYFSLLNEYPVLYLDSACNPTIFDFSIIGEITPSWRSELLKKSSRIFYENSDQFELIYEDSEVQVYKNKKR